MDNYVDWTVSSRCHGRVPSATRPYALVIVWLTAMYPHPTSTNLDTNDDDDGNDDPALDLPKSSKAARRRVTAVVVDVG